MAGARFLMNGGHDVLLLLLSEAMNAGRLCGSPAGVSASSSVWRGSVPRVRVRAPRAPACRGSVINRERGGPKPERNGRERGEDQARTFVKVLVYSKKNQVLKIRSRNSQWWEGSRKDPQWAGAVGEVGRAAKSQDVL